MAETLATQTFCCPITVYFIRNCAAKTFFLHANNHAIFIKNCALDAFNERLCFNIVPVDKPAHNFFIASFKNYEICRYSRSIIIIVVTQFLMRFIYVATDQNREHLVTQWFSGSELFPKLLRESQQAFAKNGLRKLVFIRWCIGWTTSFQGTFPLQSLARW